MLQIFPQKKILKGKKNSGNEKSFEIFTNNKFELWIRASTRVFASLKP
jgi:hypothetical protein